MSNMTSIGFYCLLASSPNIFIQQDRSSHEEIKTSGENGQVNIITVIDAGRGKSSSYGNIKEKTSNSACSHLKLSSILSPEEVNEIPFIGLHQNKLYLKVSAEENNLKYKFVNILGQVDTKTFSSIKFMWIFIFCPIPCTL